MKSIIIAAAFLLVAFTKSFAADVKVSPSVLRTFQTTFSNASDVQWTTADVLYRAEFTVEGERAIAFFSMENGSLVATSRYITVQDLPAVLRSSLKTRAAGANIMEVFEVHSNGALNYYVTIRQDDKKVILKSDSIKWSVYKK